jgi:hypothetical protein
MEDYFNLLQIEDNINLLANARQQKQFLNARFLPSKGDLDSPIFLRLAQLSPSLFVTFIILCKEFLLKLL